jgi:chromosomal replication initiation ATPase DnaA
MDYRSFPGIAIRKEDKKNITHRVIEATIKATGVAYHHIASKSRKREYVEARHIIHYLMNIHTRMPLASIGALTGRDHATVLNSKKKVEQWTDDVFGIQSFKDKLKEAESIVKIGFSPRVGVDIVNGKKVKKVIHGSK